ncbi:MAG TPA: M28 family peptidase [Dehalococcoidia bacterium]|nr:M28 family peptidase [Dehalococcoidia bacterium]
MPGRAWRLLAALFVSLSLFVAACGGGSSTPVAPTVADPTAALEPTPSPSPAPAVRDVRPDGERILGYVRKLADEIGPRPAGTPAERQAVDYLVGLLRSFGYDVSIQDFTVTNESGREAKVELTSPAGGPPSLTALPLARSASGSVSGRLVPSGLGRPSEFPASVSGNIALIERGELTFQEKVINAMGAGARGVIIFNNQPGTFLGSLSQESRIPAASISQEDGQSLLRAAGSGAVEARVTIGPAGTAVAHNVIAKPPGKDCETVTGGHFDSVPQAPGASDNATGTATVIEVAGVLAQSGQMGAHCFVLWGAEEIGLVGSAAYVASLRPEQRARLKAVLNLDMVGVGNDTWLLIGSPDLQARGQTIADQLGIGARRGSLTNASSDHASFISAGIPALMLHRWEDPLLHTPQDVSSRVQPRLLEEAARFSIAFLQSFAAGGG